MPRIFRLPSVFAPCLVNASTFDLHVTELLKQCSQRIYLLRLLYSQGLSNDQLKTVFVGLIISRLLYALPVWECLLVKLVGLMPF